VPVLQRLDAAAVRRWCAAALDDLRARRQEIDDLNVYPVPDGDTGTNMLLTMESVAEAIRGARVDDLGATMKALAHGALVGARGNSGVILSQVLRGFADVLGPLASAGGDKLKEALDAAVTKAYDAVAQPAEGTILSVAKGAAQAARAVDGDDFKAVITAAAAGAREALARTTEQLPALKQAGVVDAGGRGLVVVLEALAAVFGGGSGSDAVEPAPVVPRDTSALTVARESGSDEFAYEVQYLLDADDAAVPALRERLGGLGDSLVVVGGDGLFNVHVHVNDVGAAIEAGIEAGRPHRIAVTRFEDQIAAQEQVSAHQRSIAGVLGTVPGAARRSRAIVAVVPGDGLARLYADAGAHVVTGGPTMNPSAGELIRAIEAVGAAEVVVLPNDSNVLATARQAAGATTGCEIHVIPTKSPVQGLAALAVHDEVRSFTDDTIAMASAATATRWAEVTVAVRDAQTSAGACRAGDVLGLIEGDVAVIGDAIVPVAAELVDRLLISGGELVTLIAGADLPTGEVDRLAELVHTLHPVVEVETHDGGQPHYPLLLGVE
jgi:DAK2 domain fusion protein YloV